MSHAAILMHHMGALLVGNTPVNLAFYSKKKFASFRSFYESSILNKRLPNSIKLNELFLFLKWTFRVQSFQQRGSPGHLEGLWSEV